MTLLDRYINGEINEVYEEIYALEQEAFNEDIFRQVHLVLGEIFKRVAFNLDIIYKELQKIDYLFVRSIKYDWQRPRLGPDPNTEALLSELKRKIKDCGHLPLSLEYFYRLVGSCNFCWDWETNPDIPWEGADPIDIPPLKDLLKVVYDDYDNEDILISGDYLQKDNVSGSCYNIELTPAPSIDSLFLGWDVPFIEYLRLTLDNGGFSRAFECNYDSLNSFCNSVRPQLQKI
jgi:hypothetical protein